MSVAEHPASPRGPLGQYFARCQRRASRITALVLGLAIAAPAHSAACPPPGHTRAEFDTLKHSGFEITDENREDVGVVFGSGAGGQQPFHAEFRRRLQPHAAAG